MSVPSATFSLQSRLWVYCKVALTGADADELVTLPVAFAFVPDHNLHPEDSDFVAGEWDLDAGQARCLVGPGTAKVFGDGARYWVWVKVTGTIEEPVERIGSVLVY